MNCPAKAITVATAAVLAVVLITLPAEANCPTFHPHMARSTSGTNLLSRPWTFGHYTGEESQLAHLRPLIGYTHFGIANRGNTFIGLWRCADGSYQSYVLPHDFEPTLFIPDGSSHPVVDSKVHEEEHLGHSIKPPDVQTISERYPTPGYARVHSGFFSILNGGNPQPGEAPWASVDGVARYANSPEGIDTIVRATYGPNGAGVLYPDSLNNFKRWAVQYGMNENIVGEVERKINERSASQGKDPNR